jgi:hypothetical protein
MNKFGLLFAGALVCAASAASQAATYTVTNTSSSELIPGSLGWALDQADNNPGADLVKFAAGPGPVTIDIMGLYITDEVIIDGTTQAGYDGRPSVTLRNNSTPVNCMLQFAGSANNSIVRGLGFSGVTYQGVVGVFTDGLTIENCWFGVDRNLAPAGSGNDGVLIGLPGGALHSDITVKKCLFANLRTAVKMNGTLDCSVLDCAIGTDFTGTAVLPLTGTGIYLNDCEGTFIGSSIGGAGNVIANCGGEGIGTLDSRDTVILNNRIFNNVGSSIDYDSDSQARFNDTQDLDSTTGGEQNRPSLKTVTRADGTISIIGTLDGRPSTSYIVEVFASERLHNSIRSDAKYKVGLINGTSDIDGDMNFNSVFVDTLPPGQLLYYTATATRTDQSYGTSELSDAVMASYEQIYRESSLDTAAGWNPSGVDSGPEYPADPTSPDDVDLSRTPGNLNVIVRPSTARNRIAGWTNQSIMHLPDQIGTGLLFVRAKFYVYASNAMDAPLNTVPSFRARIENEGAILASTVFQYAMTGRSGPDYEPYYNTLNSPTVEAKVGPSIRPSNSATKPSLYRVDYVPPLTPSTAGTRIGATFESMATEDPADGVLSLAEVQLATFQVLGFTNIKMLYQPDPNFGLALSIDDPGTALQVSSGQFNVEPDFQAGRRQALDLPGEVPLTSLATVTQAAGVGTILDTLNVPADKMGAGLLTVAPDISTTAPRVTPGQSYLAIFIMSSDVPTVASTPGEAVQGGISMQMQTGGGAVTTRLELVGPASMAGAPGSPAYNLLKDALPGSNSQNWFASNFPFPVTDRGGAYVVLLPSPLSYDTRPLTPGNLGPWGTEPAEGIAAASLRDISVGVNVISQPANLRVSPSVTIPWAAPNRARVRVAGVVVAEAPDIDDGGSDY